MTVISVEYEVICAVKVIDGVVQNLVVHLEDFNASQPVAVYAEDEDYINSEDPRFKGAVEAADRVVAREIRPLFRIRPDGTH